MRAVHRLHRLFQAVRHNCGVEGAADASALS
jgi:hypothetical protein